MKRFITLFIVVMLFFYGMIYLPFMREHVVGPFTEGVSQFAGRLIQLFGGQVWIKDNILTLPEFSVRVVDMCNGVEATIIFWAALIAFPAPWLYKLKGLLIGTLTIHALNIVRIISLLYIGAYKPEWFHWMHWYVWDALIMLDILIVFLAWIRLMPAPKQDQVGVAAIA